jgi:hypothetical protein
VPRKSSPQRPQARELTAGETAQAIPVLEKRIAELKAIEISTIQQKGDPRCESVEKKVNASSSSEKAQPVPDLCLSMCRLHRGGPLREVREGTGRIGRAIQNLVTLMRSGKIEREERAYAPVRDRPDRGGRDVFLVHGRDETSKQQIARFLEKLGLNPIILHEQPSAGKTIIEKFEEYAGRARFAVVLLTPDDVGGPSDGSKTQPRARQNVIFELGFFVAALGRANVAALYKGGLEIPSDYGSVVYTELDDRDGWKLQLAKEIKAAGIDVDLNQAI